MLSGRSKIIALGLGPFACPLVMSNPSEMQLVGTILASIQVTRILDCLAFARLVVAAGTAHHPLPTGFRQQANHFQSTECTSDEIWHPGRDFLKQGRCLPMLAGDFLIWFVVIVEAIVRYPDSCAVYWNCHRRIINRMVFVFHCGSPVISCLE
jgi:hypothetical protein